MNIIKIRPDREKAKALLKMAEITLNRIKDASVEKYPTNILVDYYDVIQKLLEAVLSLEGVKLFGEGAHREAIDYVFGKYSLPEPVRLFVQELREYRNEAAYDGFTIRSDYVKANEKRILMIIDELKNRVKVD